MLESIIRARPLLIYGVFILSLWFSVSNVVPFSVAFVLLSPLLLLALLDNRSFPPIVLWITSLYALFLVSTLFYSPAALVSPEFYRRDGNVFVTLLPILIGGTAYLHVNAERTMSSFVHWTTSVNVALIIVFMITGGTVFFYEPGTYHALFEAHNAAGGFLATVSALSLGIFLANRSTVSLLVFTANAFGLVLTNSRGSVLGIMLAIALVCWLKERFVTLVICAATSSLAIVLVFAYPNWIDMGQPAGVLDTSASLNVQQLTARDANVLDRALFLWPRALDLFLESPIIGTGFGSYNDLPYRLEGQRHILAFNQPPTLTFSSAHAHNTYLHVMAENGLIGIVVLIAMLVSLRKALSPITQPALQKGLILAYWTAIFSSFTEHRLFTPSQMLPFTILLGLALASARHRRYLPPQSVQPLPQKLD